MILRILSVNFLIDKTQTVKNRKNLIVLVPLYKIDSALGNGNAFKHYQQYVLLKEKLNSDNVLKKSAQEKFQREMGKQKEEQGKKDTLAAAEKKRNRIVLVLGSCVLVLIAVFAGFMYNRFKVTQKQKLVIEQKEQETQHQKHLIEEKQLEILDSITYAQRLQNAILPSLDDVKKQLPQSFILYKPKDIVAGDFYWMHTISHFEGGKGDVLIAAADFTGHGVPGAMVSVVCSNALNRAVIEFNLRDTGAILDKTRELVIETFERTVLFIFPVSLRKPG